MVRCKNRYFTAEIIPADSAKQPLSLKKYDVLSSVIDVTEQIHGEFGAAAIRNGLEIKYFNESTHMTVIRCRHGPHRLLASSLPFLSTVGKRKVQLRSVYTGATMLRCFKFIKRFHQDKISEAFKTCKTEQEKTKFIETMSKTNFEF